MVTKFKSYLAKTNLAKNTITSYVWTVQYFLNHYGEVNKKNLLAYKGYLVENFKPQTVNIRLQGINKYLEFTKQDKLKVNPSLKLMVMRSGISLCGSWLPLEHVLVNCSTSKRNISKWVILICIVKAVRFDDYTSPRIYGQKPKNG